MSSPNMNTTSRLDGSLCVDRPTESTVHNYPKWRYFLRRFSRNPGARRFAAYACLAAGLAGLALPILPGIPLLVIGVSLLGPTHPIRRLLARWLKRSARKRPA